MHHIWARLIGAFVFALWSASLAAITIGGVPGEHAASAAALPITAPTELSVAEPTGMGVVSPAPMDDRGPSVASREMHAADAAPEVVEPPPSTASAPAINTAPDPVLAGPPPAAAPVSSTVVATPGPIIGPVTSSVPTATAAPTVPPSPTPGAAPSVTPTPTATPAPTVVPSPTATPVPVLSLVPSVVFTPVPPLVVPLVSSVFFSAPPTPTPPPTPAAVPVPTPTPPATAPPDPTPTATPTPSPTPVATATPTPTATTTPTPTATPTPTPNPTATATPIPTAGPPPVGGFEAGVRPQAIPAGAVSISVGQNAAEVVAANPAGTTFVFAPGVHRGVAIRPRDGDSYLGRAGAILSGAQVLTGFAPRDGYWAVGGQRSELFGGGGCEFLADGSRYQSCARPEQLFLDGETLRQVPSVGELGVGRWYFDYARDRVYIGSNPAGRTIELSTTPNAFFGSARNVRIAGLVIERYANRAQTGAIQAGSSRDWVVEQNELRLNHGYGLRIGQGMQVLGNYVHRNGQLGVGGIGDDVLVAGNEIAYNHTAGYLEEWEAGGTKFVLTKNLVFRDNWVHNNSGRGVWTDIDNVGALITNNLVEWNTRGGIVHEISYDAVIRDNVVRNNGLGFDGWVWGAQILIQNSSDVEVFGNDVTVSAAGGNGITIVDQSRGTGPRGPYRSDRVTVTDNTIRHLGLRGRNGAPNGCNQLNVFDQNVYEAPSNWFSRSQFEWCGLLNWSQFRNAAGQEVDGTRATRSAPTSSTPPGSS